MKILTKKLELGKLQYYETHLSIINCLLPVKMTPTEIKVLACFMSLEGAIAIYRFGPSAKKIVMEQLKLSPAGLSNYISSLKKNKFLKEQGDLIQIIPLLLPEPDEQIYNFKLVNNTNGN